MTICNNYNVTGATDFFNMQSGGTGFAFHNSAGVILASIDGTGTVNSGTISANAYKVGGVAGVTKTCTVLPTVSAGIITSC
jgi:hypothetical protein